MFPENTLSRLVGCLLQNLRAGAALFPADDGRFKSAIQNPAAAAGIGGARRIKHHESAYHDQS